MDTICTTYADAPHMPLAGQRICLYDASHDQHHFCHHPALGSFRNRLYAMWSNGLEGEDEIGQRVLYAVSDDGLRWSEPMVLCEAFPGKQGPVTLTAAGFHTDGQRLVAYVAAYEYADQGVTADKHGRTRKGSGCVDTACYALVSEDGARFSAPQDLRLPLCPNFGPQRLQSGRLLMTGNWAHAYTDDPAGLTGWTLRGFCPEDMLPERPARDDPSYFWQVSKAMGLPGALCEGAFLQGPDGTLHMLHRSYGPCLFASDSADGGESWSRPVATAFPNGNAKFWLGRLPDGRYVFVGNPGPDTSRCPLVLSLAGEDMAFTAHYLLESQPVSRKFDGIHKGGMYAYPHALAFDGALYVIYSVWKEDIRLARVPLALF